MRRRTGLVLAAVAAASLAAGVVVATTPAGADATPAFGAPLDPTQVRGSIAYLRQTFGVSEREALRRLQLQQTAQVLVDRFARRAADTSGGLWIDQAHGGQLVVATTAPQAAAALLRDVPDRTSVRVQKVAHPLAELRATQQRLAARLGDGPGSVVLPRVVAEENQVVVFRRDWIVSKGLRITAAPAVDAVDRAVAAEGGRAVVRPLVEPEPLFTPDVDKGYCHPLFCGS
ncbi:MAG: hypothetical protein E6F99_28675, partial [Actinobacteria bacterium]